MYKNSKYPSKTLKQLNIKCGIRKTKKHILQ